MQDSHTAEASRNTVYAKKYEKMPLRLKCTKNTIFSLNELDYTNLHAIWYFV